MTAVNALHRGLPILRAINDGHAQLREISAATKLPKSTIARMLETLVAGGYVAQDEKKGYHVTARVLALSRGYNANEFLLKAAQPVLEGLRRHQIWPSDLAVFDQDAMVILDTGRDPGTLSLNRTVGSRLPVLVTSLGRAFLGFCRRRAGRADALPPGAVERSLRCAGEKRRHRAAPARPSAAARLCDRRPRIPAYDPHACGADPGQFRAGGEPQHHGGAKRDADGAIGEKPAAGAERRGQNYRHRAVANLASPQRGLSAPLSGAPGISRPLAAGN